MQVRLHFKTPDVAERELDELRSTLSDPEHPDFIEDEDEREDKLFEAEKVLEKFLRYGECLSVEIDIESGTAKVLETK